MKKFLSDKKISYYDLANYCFKGTLEIKYPQMYCIDRGQYYSIYSRFTDETIYIFKNKIEINLIKADKSIINQRIICHLELTDLIKELKIDIKNIFIDDNEELCLERNIKNLNKWIKNNKLQLNEITLKIPDIQPKLINLKSSYNPCKLSKFFYKYFPYEDEENDGKIEYIDSVSRREIFENLENLYDTSNLRNYKFTGPSSNGKSFTLFYFSRCYKNIIYLNLKVIKNQNKEENLEMIISELSGLFLLKEEIDTLNIQIKDINTDKNIFEIFLEILKLILNFDINKLILIIDQYKCENYSTYPNFMKNINSLIDKYKALKLVLCSSINDNENRDNVLINLENNKGNPEYNENNQDCVFYYADLYKKKNNLKTPINYLFSNKQNYKHLFRSGNSKKKVFEEISQKIQAKMETFRVSHLSKNRLQNEYIFFPWLIEHQIFKTLSIFQIHIIFYSKIVKICIKFINI